MRHPLLDEFVSEDNDHFVYVFPFPSIAMDFHLTHIIHAISIEDVAFPVYDIENRTFYPVDPDALINDYYIKRVEGDDLEFHTLEGLLEYMEYLGFNYKRINNSKVWGELVNNTIQESISHS